MAASNERANGAPADAGAERYLRIEGVRKEFDGFVAVDDVSLDIRKGEIFALLGGSGSGKSTLLRCLAGFERPTKGKIVLDGEVMNDLPPYERPINMMFQSYALFPHMTVEQNIAFGLKQDGMAKDAIRKRVGEMLEMVQLGKLAKRKPHQLSGGQQQRVAIARALARKPKLLLLDEPFGALDAAVRRDLRRWLREVHEARGTTTVFVTHDQEEAFELADRVVVTGEGRIEQIGTPDEIYDHPATPFVARFLGATVELPVTLRAGRVEAAGVDASHLPRVAYPDGAARLFLRPGEISPVVDQTSPFSISAIASTGATLRLFVNGPNGLAFDMEVPRRSSGAADIRTGTPIRLRPEAGRVFAEGKRAAQPAPPAASTIFKENRS